MQDRHLRALFVDANDTLATVTEKLLRAESLPVGINRNPSITPDDLPGLLGDAEIMIVDHTAVPAAIAAKCAIIGAALDHCRRIIASGRQG